MCAGAADLSTSSRPPRSSPSSRLVLLASRLIRVSFSPCLVLPAPRPPRPRPHHASSSPRLVLITLLLLAPRPHLARASSSRRLVVSALQSLCASASPRFGIAPRPHRVSASHGVSSSARFALSVPRPPRASSCSRLIFSEFRPHRPRPPRASSEPFLRPCDRMSRVVFDGAVADTRFCFVLSLPHEVCFRLPQESVLRLSCHQSLSHSSVH